MSSLPFTGERFTPECLREMWYEHYHRYAFVRAMVAGRRVADVACGEGYGAMLLAKTAASVHGLDISAEAIEHARTRYAAQTNLQFEQGDACKLPWADQSLDVVTSFETLEHLHDQESLIAGFARVLRDDGVLVISSPDKRTYSDLRGFQNEFHVRELYRDELLTLLGRHFGQVRLYGQKLLFQSAIWREQWIPTPTCIASVHTAARDASSISDHADYAPMYYIAVCTQNAQALPELAEIDLFGDADETVYRHYEHEIRKNMQAGAVLQQADSDLKVEKQAHENTRAALADAEARLQQIKSCPQPRPWWRRWSAGSE
ncbi:MAG: class I SAM-dependent methyltransferase [Pseudomonadota bacterium]|nr:class I SAM-dependent methyltransferase [Pseudomonadota bacterium]